MSAGTREVMPHAMIQVLKKVRQRGDCEFDLPICGKSAMIEA